MLSVCLPLQTKQEKFIMFNLKTNTVSAILPFRRTEDERTQKHLQYTRNINNAEKQRSFLFLFDQHLQKVETSRFLTMYNQAYEFIKNVERFAPEKSIEN